MPRPASSRPARRVSVEALEDRIALSGADFSALAIDPTAYDLGHILVRLRPDADPGALRVLGGAHLESPLALVPGLWEVCLDAGVSVQDALAAFQASPLVLDATPNFRVSLNQFPNDTQFASQWGLHNTGQTGGTADADIDAPAAWDVTTGSAAVTVAVIDTGIDYAHPDLAANMWRNTGEVAGDGVDNDGNGFVDDVHGYDFANNDGNPFDDQGHGTHVAGTIGAVSDNGLGVAGVAWNVRLMAVKFLDSSGNGTVANAIRALNYAVQMGATISNNSYGGNTAEDADPLFSEAIRNAAAFGHIFVAGAGNSSNNNDASGFYPANFDLDNVISVAATDHNDQLASFSNYGAASVDLAAPGVDILSTVPGGGYASNSGTSMATPHVAGVVALVRSLHPTWTYRQVIDQVLGAVDYVPGLDGRVVTAGRLNAARALLDTDGPRVVATDPSGGVGGVISTMRVVFNEPVDPTTFTLDDVSLTGPNGAIAVTAVAPVAGSFNRKFDLSFAPQITRGTYQVVVGPAVADRAGNLMDQDGDGVLGEPGDAFTGSFLLGDQHVFRSTDTPKPLVPFTVSTSTLTVTEDLSIADVDVRLNITTPEVGFIDVALVSPAGTRVSLAPITGLALGANYRNTVFDDEATAALSSGTAPFTGSFRPSAALSALDNQITIGTWRLEVNNLFGGSIDSWDLLVVANPPRLTVADVAVAEGDAGTSLATFTVRLSNAIDQPVTVDYATAAGTATAGDDYDGDAGTLTFAPGETEKTITVAVRGDAADEPNETFLLNLTNAANATLTDAQAVGTILNDELLVSVNDVTIAEGNSGTVNAAFTVTLSAASGHAVAVGYATAAGTAASGTDFVAAAGTITFAPGETSRTLSVQVRGDTRYERSETFLVNLSATDAMLLDGQGVGTIGNDDAVPLVWVGDVSVTEGDGGAKNLNFTVNLTASSDDTVTVDYATADGTATAGSDYTAASGTVTFTPGQTYRTVGVVVASDTALEPTETLLLNLSRPVNAVMLDGQAVGTVLTDDVSLSVDDTTAAEGDGAPITFTVRLSTAVGFEVRVNYATANGTASAGADYVGTSGVLAFAPGETERTVTLVGIGDARDEADETFFLNLSGAVNAAVADAQGRASLVDDDPAPVLSVSDATVVEGPSGTRNLNFVVTLSAPSGQNVTVNYTTADGTAAAGSDYLAKVGTVSFWPGTTAQTVSVTVYGDATAEVDETVLLSLFSPTFATIADDEAVGTIQDDDSLLVDDATLVEGDGGAATAVFTVRLLAAREHVVSVVYATANGSAQGGGDYLAAAGTLTFAPGETEKTVAVSVVGDVRHEGDETVFLNLSSPSGALIKDGQGVLTLLNDDAVPVITISDAAVAEGNGGTRNATFTLTLSEPSGQNVTVQYATADGTATAGSDYVAKAGTVTFFAGGTTTTVSVTVNGDTVAEGGEAFSLLLSNPMNATLADAQGDAVLFDDDPLPAVSVADASFTEGNSGTKVVWFTVSLSAASAQPVTVQATTAEGTAMAGDYVAKTELITFNAGQTSRSFNITINGDANPEATEAFLVRLSAPTNAVLGDAEAVGTVLNDDSVLRVNDVTITETDEGTTTAVFTVSLTGPPPADEVRVAYSTANGSASAGSDYVGTSGVLTFAPGETTQTVTVVVAGDRLNEANETFYLNFSAAVNATIADSQGVATISDNGDPAPTISIADAVVVEGPSGTRTLNFVARLSAASGRTVTVNYATANGTATAGSDYLAKTGTLTFWAGTTAQTVSVTVNGDGTAELDETLFVNLSAPTNATIAGAQAVGTIQDDDSLRVDDVTIVEGDDGTAVARFVVRLLVARAEAVTVAYATANGTAAGGADYLAGAGTLTFAAGETAKTVDVLVVGDRLDEAAEMIFLNLSNATGAVIGDGQGAATIADDDATPALSIGTAVVVGEGNAGTRAVTFTVTLSEPSGQNVTVAYATQDGTALAGSDYQAVSGTLTFSPGQTVRTITVQVIGDTAIEGNEAFQLILSNPVNATPTSTQATATIVDDESLGLGGNSVAGWSSGSGGGAAAPNRRGPAYRGLALQRMLSRADAAFARWSSPEALVPDSVLFAILTRREK